LSLRIGSPKDGAGSGGLPPSCLTIPKLSALCSGARKATKTRLAFAVGPIHSLKDRRRTLPEYRLEHAQGAHMFVTDLALAIRGQELHRAQVFRDGRLERGRQNVIVRSLDEPLPCMIIDPEVQEGGNDDV
jgi:hypothetical protein